MRVVNQSADICSVCVMDHTAKDFVSYGADGCNYCIDFRNKMKRHVLLNSSNREEQLNKYFAEIKARGKGKKYDSIVGLSGGVDSSWVLYLAVKNGLRPLAVHMDNGWNSELSQENIENLVRKLNVDLYTHVIDWNEYKQLQQAFFDADVIDIELLYDNALFKVNHSLAAKYNIQDILSGSNTSTEGMQMPLNWAYRNKLDKRNIFSIWRKKGPGTKLHTFPTFGFADFLYYTYVRKVRWVPFLDYFDYNKAQAVETLQREVGYRPYLHKHYESVFTRFYQGFILPEKFNADKRKVHLSTLVVTNQMTRESALEVLQHIPYPSEQDLREDTEYFLKKMGWTREQLTQYLERPEVPHEFYGTENWLWDGLEDLKTLVKKVIRYKSPEQRILDANGQ